MEATLEKHRTNGHKVTIPGPSIKTMLVTLEGTKPFLSSAMPPHVLEELKTKGEGKAAPKTPKRNGKQQFNDSLYTHPDGGHGWRAAAFKDCIQKGAIDVAGVTGTSVQRNVHVYGDGGVSMVKIEGDPKPYENFYRNSKTNGAGVTTLAEFKEWYVTLQIEFNDQIISADQVIHALNQGGFSTGIGHKRVLGYGRFRVKSTEIE